MQELQSLDELNSLVSSALNQESGTLQIKDKSKLQNDMIDTLVFNATFNSNQEIKDHTRQLIYQLAKKLNIHPASINDLYFAIGKGEVGGFTVPAINVRMMTYDTAQVVFGLMMKHNIGALIFEIARSEMGYTDQKPIEYTTSILAAAIKSGYEGPVFLQGDHFQFSASGFKENPEEETAKIKELIQDSITARFFNIDIDASTLVELDKENLDEQQRNNYMKSAELTRFIREIEPEDVTVSIGGEIGHIGGTNSTVEDFRAFMEGYQKELQGENIIGISKVSVQTGTSHGGIPLADGTIADVDIDFEVLKSIGDSARNEYHIGGPVQHGASTLPIELFDKFPEYKTIEIHLATGFQNIVYETMPEELRTKMVDWTRENTKGEWKDSMNEDQNIYQSRKKAIGPFKKELWMLPDADKGPIRKSLEEKFEELFTKLNVLGTGDIAKKYAIFSSGENEFKTSGKHAALENVDDLDD